jgi:hypothetical protein
MPDVQLVYAFNHKDKVLHRTVETAAVFCCSGEIEEDMSVKVGYRPIGVIYT